MNPFFYQAYLQFKKETEDTLASWRILRVTTLIDLFMLDLHKFIYNPNENSLLKITNFSVMIQYNLIYGVYDVEYYYKNSISKSSIEEIILNSMSIFSDLESTQQKSHTINLFNEYNYLNQLKDVDYSFVIFETLKTIVHEAIIKIK